MKFHHIGIFTKSISYGKKQILSFLTVKNVSKVYYDKSLGVKVLFIKDKSNITYEIVSPLGKKNPVKKVIKENNNILNHIAYKVKNFDKKVINLRKNGFAPLIKPTKAIAFKKKRVCFFLTPLNFIIEIIEDD